MSGQASTTSSLEGNYVRTYDDDNNSSDDDDDDDRE
jgi:hypothetical protein